MSVEAEEGGRMFVTGRAAPGATVRLYLNETLIAPGGAGGDGNVSFAIGRGVRPGDYRVRLDDVDPVSGEVKSRAEVAFHVPQPLAVPLPPAATPLVTGPAISASQPSVPAAPAAPGPIAGRPAAPPPATASTGVAHPQPSSNATAAVAPAREFDPGTIVVPEINTAIVARGDNLWRISRRIYGRGVRYTVIYDANQTQIRNRHRIYPGQVFVLPDEQERNSAETKAETR
jgi:nucleoid-associated protein YgaU